jgi:hypothetical protein
MFKPVATILLNKPLWFGFEPIGKMGCEPAWLCKVASSIACSYALRRCSRFAALYGQVIHEKVWNIAVLASVLVKTLEKAECRVAHYHSAFW